MQISKRGTEANLHTVVMIDTHRLPINDQLEIVPRTLKLSQGENLEIVPRTLKLSQGENAWPQPSGTYKSKVKGHRCECTSQKHMWQRKPSAQWLELSLNWYWESCTQVCSLNGHEHNPVTARTFKLYSDTDTSLQRKHTRKHVWQRSQSTQWLVPSQWS
jgi:hypothetical protein